MHVTLNPVYGHYIEKKTSVGLNPRMGHKWIQPPQKSKYYMDYVSTVVEKDKRRCYILREIS